MIALRDLRPDDEPVLLRWRNLPEVARYMYSDHQITPAEHGEWFSSIPGDPKRRYWVIVCEGEDVGLVNLYDIDAANSRCFWAFYLASPSVRGKGVGSFVEYSILQHVFDEMGLDKLCCEVLGFNEPVVKMHARFGFQQEGLFRRHVVKNGEPMDVVRLAILSEDWQRMRQELAARLRGKGLL
jgi:UDP-4-amino-4,6-dideoxy-N-acetyl-beta-L-altrosamine N-acetyltransferase